ELKGDTRKAIRLMERAAEEERQARVSKEGGAWYLVRLGEMHWNEGRLAEAARHYEAALKSTAKSAPALAALAQVRAAQGKLDEAAALYAKAAALNPDPRTLAALGDLYLRTGKDVLGQVLFDRLDKLAAESPGPYARELALFYCDHDRKLPLALELA